MIGVQIFQPRPQLVLWPVDHGLPRIRILQEFKNGQFISGEANYKDKFLILYGNSQGLKVTSVMESHCETETEIQGQDHDSYRDSVKKSQLLEFLQPRTKGSLKNYVSCQFPYLFRFKNVDIGIYIMYFYYYYYYYINNDNNNM